MPPKPHYRPKQPDRNLSSHRAHTTSLSERDRRLVLRLCLFSVAWPRLIDDEELKKALYRFGYAIRPPTKLKWPRKWLDGAGLANGPLAWAIATVRQLLDRPDALKRLPPPTPALGTNMQTQSPLFSKIPPEIRSRIFELALVREDLIQVPVDRTQETWPWWRERAPKEDLRKSMPPSITQTCHLIRKETIPIFMGLNEICFDLNRMDEHEAPEKWVNTMRPHLSSIKCLTFLLTSWVGSSHRNVIVNIDHDPARNCWNVTSLDDWSNEDPNIRSALACDSELLRLLMEKMMDQRSPADLTPEYLLWLIKDLKRIYYQARTALNHPARRFYESRHLEWFQEHAIGRLPDVARPPDMYTTDLEEEFLGKKR